MVIKRIVFKEFELNTPKREDFVDITEEVINIVRRGGVKEGICRIFAPHTTAGITINENADPSVVRDVLNHLRELVPQKPSFSHSEGNSDAHIKSSLVGTSLDVIVHDGRLMLGTWQGLYFCEFDGPRHRKVYVQVQGE